MDLDQLLKEKTPYKTFRPGQKEALTALIEGRHTLAILATGSGKSLIYQLYHRLVPGLVVMVSPLQALMEDQVLQLQQAGFKRSVALHSMTTGRDRRFILSHLPQWDFLILSPEMLAQPKILKPLSQVPIRLFVVDEAHCISQWGKDFRSDYTGLLACRKVLHFPLTLALTATANRRIQEDIETFLLEKEEPLQRVTFSMDRPNLFYGQVKVEESQKREALLSWLKILPKPGIIYVHQKEELEDLASFLEEKTPFRLDTYHADRRSEDRLSIQADFQANRLDFILATSAFGMGINQVKTRFVLHYHLPQSLNEYVQEAGRCGRDGRQAMVLSLYTENEWRRLKFFQDKLWEEKEGVLANLEAYYRMKERKKKRFLEQLPEELRERLLFYSNHYRWIEEAKTHYMDYLKVRSQEIQEVLAFLTGKTCLRQQLLRSFDQVLEASSSSWCCSNCQTLDKNSEILQAYLKSGEAKFLNQEEVQREDWRRRLQKLFQTKP